MSLAEEHAEVQAELLTLDLTIKRMQDELRELIRMKEKLSQRKREIEEQAEGRVQMGLFDTLGEDNNG